MRSALLWSYVLSGGGFVVSGAVTFLMAAILQPRDYGVMALAMLWVTFAQMMLHQGPALAIIQRDDVTDLHFDAAFWVNLAGATLFAGLFAASAPLWASVNGTPQLTYICWALAPIIVMHALIVVPDAVLRRRLELRRLSIRILLAAVISGVAGIAAAIAGWEVWALVVQQLTYHVATIAMLWTTSSWRPRLRRIGPAIRDLRRFSLLSTSEFLAYFLASRADALLIGVFLGPVAIGLYRFALRIVEMVNELAAGGIRQVTLPDLARYQDDKVAFAERLGALLHAGAVLAFPVLGILAASASSFLGLIGPEWVAAATALRVLCVVGAIFVIGIILAPAVQAAGRPGVAAAIGWTEAALAVSAIAAVGYTYRSADTATQVLAIALATLSVHSVVITLNLWVTLRGILGVKIGQVLSPALPALLAGVVGAVTGLAVQALLPTTTSPLPSLLVIGSIATIAAGLTLVTTDEEVARRVRRRTARPRGRHAA